MVDKWDKRFIELAQLVASWSKDPSTKTGAVIVRSDRTVASLGFNGFPRNTDDNAAFYDDRDVKYAKIIHAELNAILNAKEPIKGFTLYTSLFPCDRCATCIIQSGIGRVVTLTASDELKKRWRESFDNSSKYFKEAMVPVVEI